MARLLTGLCAAALAGCGGIEKYGTADFYDQHAPEIEMVMPPNAPYISEQFRFDGEKKHPGIDIWGKTGTPVLAAAPGTVVQSFYEPVYGDRIVISHGRDREGREILTVYKHLHARVAEAGAAVARGQQIGTMGSTGALGVMVHLHFETLKRSAKRGEEYEDPHVHWAGGVGRVTCFDPRAHYPEAGFRTTYPVACK
ncbi:M23 family metallopeptidase [Roseobacteraceae bacterium NS-SX3]